MIHIDRAVDEAQHRNNHQRYLYPLQPWVSTEQIERRIRRLERETVRELHRKPWLAGRDFSVWISRCRRRHSESIARSRTMAVVRVEFAEAAE